MLKFSVNAKAATEAANRLRALMGRSADIGQLKTIANNSPTPAPQHILIHKPVAR